MMKSITSLSLFFLVACSSATRDTQNRGMYVLRWVEKPSSRGVSQEADPKDRTKFDLIASFDQEEPGSFSERKERLREGDLIAYWMKTSESRKAVLKGDVNKIGYRLLDYGHLAMLVKDPKNPNRLLLLSSQSFKGANSKEDIETLKDHSWDAYRLDQWKRIDQARLQEFIKHANSKAGHWAGYDFSGMFAMWNSNLKPDHLDKVGRDYICSTIVVAALYYSGLELDAVQRKGLLDLVSPKQVVTSKGRIIDLPEVELKAE